MAPVVIDKISQKTGTKRVIDILLNPEEDQIIDLTDSSCILTVIILYHIISYHIIAYYIISYHIISYHIILYHIIS